MQYYRHHLSGQCTYTVFFLKLYVRTKYRVGYHIIRCSQLHPPTPSHNRSRTYKNILTHITNSSVAEALEKVVPGTWYLVPVPAWSFRRNWKLEVSVFVPPGSIRTQFGSGSFNHPYIIKQIIRKTLNPSVLWLLSDFLSLRNDVNVPLKSNKQKNLKK